MLRIIADHSKRFLENIKPSFFQQDSIERKRAFDSFELENELRKQIERITSNHKAALALSGGIEPVSSIVRKKGSCKIKS